MNQQNSLTSNMTERQRASIGAIAASEAGEASPIHGALERTFDNVVALHAAIGELEKRLVGVLLPSHGEGSDDGEGHPMPVQSPMLARIERQNRRIAQAIDLIETITRRLEV